MCANGGHGNGTWKVNEFQNLSYTTVSTLSKKQKKIMESEIQNLSHIIYFINKKIFFKANNSCNLYSQSSEIHNYKSLLPKQFHI